MRDPCRARDDARGGRGALERCEPLRLRARDRNVAHPLLDRARDADARIRAEALHELRRFGIRLELKRLLRSFRKAVRGTASVIACVDVCAAVDEDLDDFVQPAERRAVQGREIGFVDGVDVSTGVEQHGDRFLGARLSAGRA